MTADIPAASKDAPTDDAVKRAVAVYEHQFADPTGEWPSDDEMIEAGNILAAHVATLTAKLEAERARLGAAYQIVGVLTDALGIFTTDEAQNALSYLNGEDSATDPLPFSVSVSYPRETARADAAEMKVREAKTAMQIALLVISHIDHAGSSGAFIKDAEMAASGLRTALAPVPGEAG